MSSFWMAGWLPRDGWTNEEHVSAERRTTGVSVFVRRTRASPYCSMGAPLNSRGCSRAIFVIGQTAKGLNSVRSVCIQSPYERPGVSCLVREHPSFSYGRFKNYDREHLGSY